MTVADLEIKAMTPAERLYAYDQGEHLEKITGCIGRLRGDFGSSGNEFWTTWEDHCKCFKTDAFKTEFDELINHLRDEGGGSLFANRANMEKFCRKYPNAAFKGNYCTEYGFKLQTAEHIYLLRCSLNQGDYNFYLYAYAARLLERQIENARQGILFIDYDGRELFRLQDGDKLRIFAADGRYDDCTCRFIDEIHFELRERHTSEVYHLYEFAERLEQTGERAVPLRASLPERCYGYLKSTNEIILIVKGETGYQKTDIEPEGTDGCSLAMALNRQLGINPAQLAAMSVGAIYGWRTSAADPASYDGQGQPRNHKRRRGRGKER